MLLRFVIEKESSLTSNTLELPPPWLSCFIVTMKSPIKSWLLAKVNVDRISHKCSHFRQHNLTRKHSSRMRTARLSTRGKVPSRCHPPPFHGPPHSTPRMETPLGQYPLDGIPLWMEPPPPWAGKHTSENITFPQLCLRAVITKLYMFKIYNYNGK